MSDVTDLQTQPDILTQMTIRLTVFVSVDTVTCHTVVVIGIQVMELMEW